MNAPEINMNIDINNPLHAAAYKLAATHFLSSDHDDWDAVRLFNAITADEDTDHWLASELDRHFVFPWKGIEASCTHPMCDPWVQLQEYMVSLAMDFVAFTEGNAKPTPNNTKQNDMKYTEQHLMKMRRALHENEFNRMADYELNLMLWEGCDGWKNGIADAAVIEEFEDFFDATEQGDILAD